MIYRTIKILEKAANQKPLPSEFPVKIEPNLLNVRLQSNQHSLDDYIFASIEANIDQCALRPRRTGKILQSLSEGCCQIKPRRKSEVINVEIETLSLGCSSSNQLEDLTPTQRF